MSYAFGGPILFQYCNIIFLVGAAWLPFGFRATDRWLRLGDRRGLIALAVVLALQTLGGDPESAYVTGLCAGGYALVLARLRGGRGVWRLGPGRTVLAALVVVVGWTVGTLVLAERLPPHRPKFIMPLALPWMNWVHRAILAAWGVAGMVLLTRWRRRGRSPLGTMLAGLGGSAVLAAALAAAQLVPCLEFTAQSGRSAEAGAHDIYPFSLEPIRLAELAWPNLFGTHFSGNRHWINTVMPRGVPARVWVPSLYFGGLPIVLALGALGFRGGPPWRGWLTAVAVVSLVASLGEFTSPIWWARWSPSVAARIGPHDPADVAGIRADGQLRDGDGSFYWALATALPGFRQFRFPSKLLTFTSLALAALAGIGWDRLAAGRSRRAVAIAAGLLALTVLAGAVAEWHRPRIVAAFAARSGVGTAFGPLDPAGAFADIRRALLQAGLLMVVALVVLRRPRSGRAGALALLVTTADLILANAPFVKSVPQHELDTKPRVVRLIEAAEREHPLPGPYRVHRSPIWDPLAWHRDPSPDRARDFVVWERDTIQPKYGLMFGVHYTQTLGVAELYDHSWFFGGFYRTIDRTTARVLNATPGQKIVVFPKRSFDLWNTRYFVLPGLPDWKNEDRGIASFLDQTERIYPETATLNDPVRRKEWAEREDFQILRNKAEYPRAWVVHEARGMEPITGLERTSRNVPMQEILYQGDPFWYDPDRHVYDPRAIAWVDSDRMNELAGYCPGASAPLSETVAITHYGPQRVELVATLERPGLVVLSDIYYPGWRLTIDGTDAPIYRANRLMRGAAVPSGTHRLVYSYRPESFRVGCWISLTGLAALAILGAWSWRHPDAPGVLPAV